MNDFILIATALGLLYMVFITPVYYSLGVLKMEYGDAFTLGDRVKCMIPVFNVMHAERLYTGRFSKVLIATIMFILFTVFRFVVIFMFSSNYILNVVSILLFLLSMVFIYAANVYSVFIVLHDANVLTFSSTLVRSIIYPLGQWYIGSYLVNVIKNYKKGNVFDGKN